MSLLNEIERKLDDRILSVEGNVCRLRKSKRVALNYLNLCATDTTPPVEIVQDIKAKETIRESSNTVSELDNILLLAKDIRNSSISKTTIQNNQPTISTEKTSARRTLKQSLTGSVATKPQRQSLREALSSVTDESLSVIETPQSANERRIADRNARFRHSFQEQLRFLSRYRMPTVISKLYFNKEKYCEQAKFLSKIYGRPHHPSSVLFQTMRPNLPNSDNNSLNNDTKSENYPQSTNDIVMKLLQSFGSLISNFERFMKVRISQKGFKATQLSSEDRTALLTMWLRGRKLLDLYEHYIKAKQRLRCTCLHCMDKQSRVTKLSIEKQQQKLHSTVPLYTPLPLPSVNIRRDEDERKIAASMIKPNLKQKKTIALSPIESITQKSVLKVSEFHEAYRSRVMLIVESAVGQNQLKNTIHSLKGCCEDQSKLGSNHNTRVDQNDLTQRWITALKLYRNVYSILLSEAQDLNHCVFLNKS